MRFTPRIHRSLARLESWLRDSRVTGAAQGVARAIDEQKPWVTQVAPRVVSLASVRYNSHSEFLENLDEFRTEFHEHRAKEMALARTSGDPIKYPGHCGICARDVEFKADLAVFHTHSDGLREPIWRERLVCPCGLSNRLRAALHFMLDSAGLTPASAVYLTEETTLFFGVLNGYCRNVTGSEYLRDGTAKGCRNVRGIRHEDITDLSFVDGTFDIVGSFEVFEHVPNYRAGLKELCRVLKPGGHMVASFPFRFDLYETLVRAKIGDEGEIIHILEPEYHGDPLDQQGVLCFYHFGWDILDAMREAGFSEAHCHFYWNWDSGYLGGALPLFHAVK